MANSDYINGYLIEADRESKRRGAEPWLKNFFKAFHKNLSNRARISNTGDRNVVFGAFSDALEEEMNADNEGDQRQGLIPPGICLKDPSLKQYIKLPRSSEELALHELLSKKKVDFALGKDSKSLLIEFKTNVQFNDVAAAMIEMMVVKRFSDKKAQKTTTTASLHLFPYRTNVEGLRLLNDSLGRPLDYIWILCTPDLKFDSNAIKSFRNDLSEILLK